MLLLIGKGLPINLKNWKINTFKILIMSIMKKVILIFISIVFCGLLVQAQNEGERIKLISTNEIYLILDGSKRYIPNMETYNRLFSSTAGVREVDQALFDAKPLGTPIEVDATLLTNPVGTVFLIAGGKKYGITSGEAMDKYGFNRTTAKANKVSQQVIDNYTIGGYISY